MTEIKPLLENAMVPARAPESVTVKKIDEEQALKDDTVSFLRQLSLLRSSRDEASQSAACTCMRSTGIPQTNWRGSYGPVLWIKSSRTCRLHPFGPTETVYLVDVPFVNRIINYSLQICLSIKNSDPCLSVAPGLRAVRRVRNDAPVIQLANQLYDLPSKSFRQDMYELFRTEKASPSDMNEDGDTILIVGSSCEF